MSQSFGIRRALSISPLDDPLLFIEVETAFYKGSKSLPLSVGKWQMDFWLHLPASVLGLKPRVFSVQGLVLPLTLFSLTLLEEAPPKQRLSHHGLESAVCQGPVLKGSHPCVPV